MEQAWHSMPNTLLSLSVLSHIQIRIHLCNIQSYHHRSSQENCKELPNSDFKAMLSKTFNLRDSFKRISKRQTMQIAREGGQDPEREQMIESFRELLLREGQLPGKHNDNHTLLRFLRMRNFDLNESKEAFLKYLKWQEEIGVDQIMKEFKSDEYAEVKRCYPHGFHGVDRSGRPVYIERIGMLDLNALMQVTTMERFLKHHVREQEKTLNWRHPACSIAAKTHIASTISILDVKNVGMPTFSKTARCLFMEIQKIDSNYYPETLHQLYIINAGSGFRVLWKVLKALLDPRTLAKIQVLGSSYRSKLLEVIDSSNLPTFIGGNCTCSDCGGCLLSDKGPWNDPEIADELQAILGSEKEYNNGEEKSTAAKDVIGFGNENVQISDFSSKASRTDEALWQFRGREVVNEPFLQKIEAFEAALKDAKREIETLEAAIEDTKIVLQGLEWHIEELKK